MKNLDIKKLVLCLALGSLASGNCFADAITVGTSDSTNTNEKSATQLVNKPSITSCPTEFQKVKISDDASQCQAFDESLTAVMVYHSPKTPNEMLNVYLSAHPALKAHEPISGRTLLSSEDRNIRVIISPDNTGSQVDILITSAQN
ncbi:hypothetical protein [Alteromonas gracilis]|uniref:hypothetical protein n=1 Tax=Alteromonas gracilis TaxID=1479524 RepID=UPI003736D176